MKIKYGKTKVFCINTNPFKQDCIVIINGGVDDGIQFLKKQKTINALKNIRYIENARKEDPDSFKNETHFENNTGVTYTTLPCGYMMLFGHNKSWVDTVDIIAHECLHLTHYVLKNAGVILCKESEEVYTYLNSYLIRQILEEIY